VVCLAAVEVQSGASAGRNQPTYTVSLHTEATQFCTLQEILNAANGSVGLLAVVSSRGTAITKPMDTKHSEQLVNNPNCSNNTKQNH
jgi:hypothetical protein